MPNLTERVGISTPNVAKNVMPFGSDARKESGARAVLADESKEAGAGWLVDNKN